MEDNSITIFRLFLSFSVESKIVCLLFIILGLRILFQATKQLLSFHSEGLKDQKFESTFWSGVNLSDIYKSFIEKPDNQIGYLEDTFGQMMLSYKKIPEHYENKVLTFKLLDKSARNIKKSVDDRLSSKLSNLQNSVTQVTLITAAYCGYLIYGAFESHIFFDLDLSNSGVIALPAFFGLLIYVFSRVIIAFISYKVELVRNQIHLFLEELSTIMQKHVMRGEIDAE